MGKYSFIIYWTIAQKLIIMNQTTNFTILSRIWNHDFYITQKSNFCTAGHKYLNKRVLRKNIFFQTGFYSQLKQFSSTFEAILMWFPSGFVGCTTDLSSRSSARCLLSGLFVFYSLTAMIFLIQASFFFLSIKKNWGYKWWIEQNGGLCARTKRK